VEKVFWVILGGAAFAAALPAVNNPRALLAGRIALGVLYIGAGALVNAIYHLTRSERLFFRFFRPGKSSSADLSATNSRACCSSAQQTLAGGCGGATPSGGRARKEGDHVQHPQHRWSLAVPVRYDVPVADTGLRRKRHRHERRRMGDDRGGRHRDDHRLHRRHLGLVPT
jgi:hypothetical protein